MKPTNRTFELCIGREKNTFIVLSTITSSYILHVRWFILFFFFFRYTNAKGKAGSEKVISYWNKSGSVSLCFLWLFSPYPSLWLRLDCCIDDSFFFFSPRRYLFPTQCSNVVDGVEQCSRLLFQLAQQNCFAYGNFPNVYILKTKISKD